MIEHNSLPILNPGDPSRFLGVLVNLEEGTFRFLDDFLVDGATGLEELGDVLGADVDGDLEGDPFGGHCDDSWVLAARLYGVKVGSENEGERGGKLGSLGIREGGE